jgi:phosphopantetheinyl transferase
MIRAQLVWLRDDAAPATALLAERLPAVERRELAGLRHPARARGFVLSRLLLRRTLSARLDCEPDDIAFTRAANGRLMPATDLGLHFSLSHAPGLAAVVVANAPCGIDAERLRAVPALRIAQRYFSASEFEWLAQRDENECQRDFLRLWTLKEASVKALGEGLANNMSRLSFSLQGATPTLLDSGPSLQLRQTIARDIVLAAVVATGAAVSWQERQVREA